MPIPLPHQAAPCPGCDTPVLCSASDCCVRSGIDQSLVAPAGYHVGHCRSGYTLDSDHFGPLGDDYASSADACLSAWEHAEGIAQDTADELAAIADYEASEALTIGVAA